MGIAKRKAGTVVRCPKCAGQVVVPNPGGAAPPGGGHGGRANGAGQLFEQSDFERFFQEEGNIKSPAAAPGPQPPPAYAPAPAAVPMHPMPQTGFDVEPVPDQPYALGPGVFLSPGKLAFLGAAVVVLMGLSFFVGLLIGRS
jgi:hypothetical protein